MAKSKRKIFITEFDKSRLEKLIHDATKSGQQKRDDLESLAGELAQAKVVDSKKIPADVVTMNSQVRIRDQDSDEVLTYTLVFPKDADLDKGAISILAPVGTAILGYAVGDIIAWPVPSGLRHLQIETVLYQPEAAKHFHL